MPNRIPLVPKPILLLVDDETNILSSLARVLRNEPYKILQAASGEEALVLLRNQSVDVVISDVRMPGMDGATFLTEVQEHWPETMRLLLTGHAELETTVRAINEGRIYRYISKPWDDEELRQVIRQALEFQYSERDRVRLEKVIERQNRSLKALNADLEKRVNQRTEELKETADMLELAYAELKNSYVTATELFSSLINYRLPKEQLPNQRVIALVNCFAEYYAVDEESARDMAMAAALYNVGKLTWDDDILKCPSSALNGGQLGEYRKYPELGASLLMTLEHLQGAARLIQCHQERWDGKGFPAGVKTTDIPYGSRVIKLAVDFIELQCGMLLDRRLPRSDALKAIKFYAGRFYDPEICDQFVHLCEKLAPDVPDTEPVVEDMQSIGVDNSPGSSTPVNDVLILRSHQLQPGMVLARTLHQKDGLLLLNQGKRLTQFIIDKLTAFEHTEHHSYTLFIQKQSAAELESRESVS